MSKTKTSKWSSLGCASPASLSGRHAGPGSTRVYYENTETGEYCYRAAGWGSGGVGVHGFYIYEGCEADGCDEWGRNNGKTYPASEFED